MTAAGSDDASSPTPWTAADSGEGAIRHAPATLRNREPILALLRELLPDTGMILEIASGSGEHAVHFARGLPEIEWQPSDPDPDARVSIAAWREQAALTNLRSPIDLDASSGEWSIARADAIVCINMVHISPWRATLGLLAGAGRLLGKGAPLYLYGPFAERGQPLAPSNAEFDRSLKSRDPAWGIHDIRAVADAARRHDLMLKRTVAMPANNLSAIFEKE